MMWGKRDDMTVHAREPFNAEPSRAALAAGTRTATENFFVRNHGPVPVLDPQTWRLSVGGLVDSVLELSLEDLQNRFTLHEIVATVQCAGNRRAGLMRVRDVPGEVPWGPGATSTAVWSGVRLADVLHDAGIARSAAHVTFDAPDVSELASPRQPFGGSIPLSKALQGEVLLAWQMNGHLLPPVHGAPVRVVVGGYIGARSVKWLQRITAQAEPSANFFQATAYRLLPPEADPQLAGPQDGLSLGPTAVNSDILSPDETIAVPTGPTRISGYARRLPWSRHRDQDHHTEPQSDDVAPRRLGWDPVQCLGD